MNGIGILSIICNGNHVTYDIVEWSSYQWNIEL